jgi:hypothetical protein
LLSYCLPAAYYRAATSSTHKISPQLALSLSKGVTQKMQPTQPASRRLYSAPRKADLSSMIKPSMAIW